MLSARARAAREETPAGQYAVVAESCTLTVAAPPASWLTLTCTAPSTGGKEHPTLLHVALPSLLLGAAPASSPTKLMLVPLDRSPAWLLECDAAALAPILDALHARGLNVATSDPPPVAGERPMTPPGRLEQPDLERMMATPSFRAVLANVEGAFAARRSLGLPDL